MASITANKQTYTAEEVERALLVAQAASAESAHYYPPHIVGTLNGAVTSFVQVFRAALTHKD